MSVYDTASHSTPSSHLQSLLDQELNEGEQLQWSCQPSVSRAVMRSLPLVIFFAVLCAFIAFFFAYNMWTAIKQGKDVPTMGVVGIGILLLVGLSVLTSPFWTAYKAKNTVYAITNERAIILRRGFFANVQSFTAEKLKDVTKRVRSDGSGDLVFERHVSYHTTSSGSTHRRVKDIGFLGIPRVNEVEDMIKGLQPE